MSDEPSPQSEINLYQTEDGRTRRRRPAGKVTGPFSRFYQATVSVTGMLPRVALE